MRTHGVTGYRVTGLRRRGERRTGIAVGAIWACLGCTQKNCLLRETMRLPTWRTYERSPLRTDGKGVKQKNLGKEADGLVVS